MTRSVNIRTSLSAQSYNDQQQFDLAHYELHATDRWQILRVINFVRYNVNRVNLHSLHNWYLSYHKVAPLSGPHDFQLNPLYMSEKILTNSLFPNHNPVKFELKRSPLAKSIIIFCPPLMTMRVTDDTTRPFQWNYKSPLIECQQWATTLTIRSSALLLLSLHGNEKQRQDAT